MHFTFFISNTITSLSSTKSIISIIQFVYYHDMMRDLHTNRNSLFINKFWSILIWYLKSKRKLNTTYYFQIDDQTKRQNAILKLYLRVYCNYKQNNWFEFFFITIFVYNNNKYINIEDFLQKFLIDYVVDFVDAFENNLLEENIFNN